MTLDEAVRKFTTELPGWWWSVCDCSVSADASCGPDRNGPDADLLWREIDLPPQDRLFDSGFHVELAQPASVAEALMEVLEDAKAALSKAKPGLRQPSSVTR